MIISVVHSQVPDLKSPVPIDPKVKIGKLDNGMTYYIRSNKEPNNRADFYIIHNVGAILEDDNQNGLAHFTEHMAFNGTLNFPKKGIINYLEMIGVKFGENLNAFTGTDVTCYNISDVPMIREGIEDTLLLILHDWSNYISFEPVEIEDERGVIREEWRTRGTAERRMEKDLLGVKYQGSKYAIRDVIGDTAVINHFNHQAIFDFYHKWYRPDLQAVIIVGDFNADTMEMKVKHVLGQIPGAKNKAKRLEYDIPDNTDLLVGIATDPEASQTNVTIYYKHNTVPKDLKNLEYYRNSLIKELILSMLNDRLAELLQDEKTPFIRARSNYEPFTNSKNVFQCSAVSKNNESLDALKILLLENEKVKKFGFTSTELIRAKTDFSRLVENLYKERDKQKNNEYVWNYFDHFTQNEPLSSIEFDYNFTNEIFPTITLDELNQIAASYIIDTNVIITVTGPEKKEVKIPTVQEIKDIYNQVKNEKIQAYVDKVSAKSLYDTDPVPGHIEKISGKMDFGNQEWTLSNGMKVIIKTTDFKEDEILMSAFSKGGTSHVKDSDMISARLLPNIISEMGLGNYSKTELEKYLSGKKVSANITISDDKEGFNGSSSPKDFETLLKMIYTYFTQPRFDEQSYNSYTSRLMAAYANQNTNPRALFNDSISTLMANHLYRSRPVNLQSLKEISLAKVQSIYKDRFCDASDFTFVFVGNIKPDSVKTVIEKYLGSIPSLNREEQYIDNHVRPPIGKVTNDFSKELQIPKTSIFACYYGRYKYSLQDIVNVAAIDHILELRYIETIREEQGGTYTVHVKGSVHKYPEQKSFITMTFDTDPKIADKMKTILHSEIQKIAENGPLDSDLQKAKEFFLKSHQDNLRENSYWVSELSEYYYNGMDQVSDYEKIVNQLTVKSIQKAAKTIIGQKNIIEVIMRGSGK